MAASCSPMKPRLHLVELVEVPLLRSVIALVQTWASLGMNPMVLLLDCGKGRKKEQYQGHRRRPARKR